MNDTPKPTSTGVCRDCQSTEEVEHREWSRSSSPRCARCGGILDRVRVMFHRRSPSRRR